jgi:hypothetical protein
MDDNPPAIKPYCALSHPAPTKAEIVERSCCAVAAAATLPCNSDINQDEHLYTPFGFFDSSLNVPPLPFSYPISLHSVNGVRVAQFLAWVQE